MAIDFALLIYDPQQAFWGRPITVHALASRAGEVYAARGIYDTRGTMIQTDMGMAVLSDQETILDVCESDPEFSGGVPAQGDVIDIPPDGDIMVGVGTYVVTDLSSNGGGETTLILQKQMTATLIEPIG